MQRAEFEQRLNEVLDRRENPALDPQLRAAAEHDEELRTELAAAEALLAGLAQREPLELHTDLSAAVLGDLQQSTPRVRLVSSPMLWIPASLAAMILVAVLLKDRWQEPTIGPTTGPRRVPTYIALPKQDVVQPEGSALAEGELPKYPQPTDVRSDAAYFAMLRRTGQAMAVLPDTLLRADMPPEVNAMAEGMRPVRNSVSAAIDALRGTLPSKSAGSES